jgi:hypothetical protein
MEILFKLLARNVILYQRGTNLETSYPCPVRLQQNIMFGKLGTGNKERISGSIP